MTFFLLVSLLILLQHFLILLTAIINPLSTSQQTCTYRDCNSRIPGSRTFVSIPKSRNSLGPIPGFPDLKFTKFKSDFFTVSILWISLLRVIFHTLIEVTVLTRPADCGTLQGGSCRPFSWLLIGWRGGHLCTPQRVFSALNYGHARVTTVMYWRSVFWEYVMKNTVRPTIVS